jgi:hypothetical protein
VEVVSVEIQPDHLLVRHHNACGVGAEWKIANVMIMQPPVPASTTLMMAGPM